MKCKKIKKLIIDFSAQKISKANSRIMAEHINQCNDCYRFQQELLLMRQSIKTIEKPMLPHSVEKRTRARCIAEITSGDIEKALYPPPFGWLKVPKVIWVAVLILTILTLIFIVPFFGELSTRDSLSPQALYTLILIIQNTLMLILSPLLIQRYGKKWLNTRL